MATDENDISDLMLEPMRQRERARRGSDMPDEKRFNMLTRGEMPPPRACQHTETVERIRDGIGNDTRVCIECGLEMPMESSDISKPAAEPECPVTMAVRVPTLTEMERAVSSLTDDGGLLSPYHRSEAARRLLRALEKMPDISEPLVAVRMPSEAELWRACFTLTEGAGALLAPRQRNEATRRLLKALEEEE